MLAQRLPGGVGSSRTGNTKRTVDYALCPVVLAQSPDLARRTIMKKTRVLSVRHRNRGQSCPKLIPFRI